MSEGIRINKYLSEVGYCSRRAADKLIDANRVQINGKVPELGTKVMPGDQVSVDGNLVEDSRDERVVLAFNKPVGIVCTTDTRVEKNNIIDYINYPTRVFPIGRLDKPSEGLIFLTNDGDIEASLWAENNEFSLNGNITRVDDTTMTFTLGYDDVNSIVACTDGVVRPQLSVGTIDGGQFATGIYLFLDIVAPAPSAP